MAYLDDSGLGRLWNKIKNLVNEDKPLWIDCGTVSSLPKTVSNAKITASMICTHSELGTPSAQTSDWTVTTASGSVTISGSISGSTTLKIFLEKSQ